MVKNLFNLDGKVAIITGGAGLLGEQHAEAIAEFGGVPVLVDINEKLVYEKAARISKEYSVDALGVRCDITKKEELESLRDQLLKKFKHIDILINNAAIDPKVSDSGAQVSFSRLEYFLLDQWNLELSVGLTGAFLCSQIFGSVMAEQKSGVILNISSDLGIISPDQRLYKKENLPESLQPVKPVTYSVIKHGLIGLTKYLATYWADKGIRANTLCPAGVYNNQPDEFVKKISQLIPMGRMAKLHEYKCAVIYLVSDASSYMTGSILTIDGGRSIL
jgi:NAD(P)-dependent dehydrogenase (short-subunit alcohol dehydrogenase family)